MSHATLARIALAGLLAVAAVPGLAATAPAPAVASAAEEPRRVRELGDLWRFKRIDAGMTDTPGPSADDAGWERVSLPHAARIDSPEVGKDYFLGVCRYRVTIPASALPKGKRAALEFDGAMQRATIWVNGRPAGEHLGGYLPFEVDLTPFRQDGAPVTVELRLDNNGSADFPPGSNRVDFTYSGGLYREARLVVTDPVHITHPVAADKPASGGVFVRCDSVSEATAALTAQTHVRNDAGAPATVSVTHRLLDPDGREVARATTPALPLAPGADREFTSALTVARPRLWHPDHPALHTLESVVSKNGVIVDTQRTRCGIRSVTMGDDGLVLNGRKFTPRGANRHMSFPWLGNAATGDMHYRDLRLLKEAGFNFVRLCHYPHSPATMDACDELGLAVIVCTPGWQCFKNNPSFIESGKRNIREMVRWHRNHPSAILWEVSLNETGGHDDYYAECAALAKAEYGAPGLLTCGDTHGAKRVDFYEVGYSEWGDFYNRPAHPGTRYAKALHREYGDYEFGGQASTTRVKRDAGEDRMLTQAWNFQWAHNRNLGMPHTLGDAIWAGIDSLSQSDRPAQGRASWWGPLDHYRLPKISYDFFRSQRDPAASSPAYESGPMVRIANAWTPRPSPTKVVVYANADEVELRLNGRTVATRRPDGGPDGAYGAYLAEADPMYWTKNQDTFAATEKAEAAAKPASTKAATTFDGGNCRHLAHPPFTFVPVPYEPGELTAVARIGGREVARHTVRTPGRPAALRLRAAELGKPLRSDGADTLFIYAEVVDAAGTVVPENRDDVRIAVAGAGRAITPGHLRAELGIAPAMVQAGTAPGTITVTAEAPGLAPASLTLRTAPGPVIIPRE